mgnify:CR=1 FL=1
MKTIRKIYDKRVFLTAFLATIIIHGELIFNKISFHDDLDTVFDGWRNSIRHGRWMYRLLSLIPEKLAGMESTPVAIGTIVAACIGLMACLFFEIFQIKKYHIQFALIIIFCAIPAVAGDFGYTGYAGYDFIGKLFCVISAYLVCKGINGKNNVMLYVLAALALACSIGEYQCHVTFFLTIMLVYFTQYVLVNQVTWKEFWAKAVYYVGTAIAGLLLYLGILQISLKISGKELTSYAGMDSYGVVGIPEYIERFIYVYKDFFNINSVADYSMIPFEWDGWRLLVLLALLALVVGTIVITVMRKEYQKTIQFAIASALLPLGLNFNFVMYGVDATHSLHMYQWVLLFVYLFVLVEYIVQNVPHMFARENLLQTGLKWMQGMVLAVALIFGILYVRYDNMCYVRLEMRQEAAIRYFTTLITRIESTEGYKDEYPVAYINEFEKKNDVDRIYTEYDYPVTNPFNAEIVNAYNWYRFMEYWCGFDPDENDPADYDGNPVVEEMPAYPDAESIQVIDEVVVVKF